MSSGAIQILQKSLEAARKDLSTTNDAIKRLTGRDPAIKPTPRSSGQERRTSSSARDPERRITAPIRVERRFSGHGRESERRITGPALSAERKGGAGGRMRAWSGDTEGPSAKRRDLTGSRSRLAGRLGPGAGEREEGGAGPRRREQRERGARPRGGLEPEWKEREGKLGNSDGEDKDERDSLKPSLQSSVVATKVPPRPNADPNEDEGSKKRNRRMFGFLMGTLQKFKENEDEAKKSDKERRRAEIEEKLEQKYEIEKETAMQARKDLFQELRSKKSKIARISYQMSTINMYEEWNAHDKLLLGYIKTKASPPIFYLPAEHTSKTEALLKETQSAIEGKITERQKEVESFLSEGKDTKMEDSFQEEVEGEGDMDAEERGRGRREGSASGDGSDKEQ